MFGWNVKRIAEEAADAQGVVLILVAAISVAFLAVAVSLA